MPYSDEDFIATWNKEKSVTKVALALGLDVRHTNRRRRAIELKRGITLEANSLTPMIERHAARVNWQIDNGCVVVFSDAHFWDYRPSTAYRALIRFIKELQPRGVINGGDAFDGAGISRHPSIGFLENKPTVLDELNACEEMLGGIEEVHNGLKSWALGNHDLRYEAHLAARVPEFAGVGGFHLKDRFPSWAPCWSTWINGDTCVKHRWKGGIHATHNNTMGAGVNIVTGHLHSLKVSAWTDYNGTRYGVDTGTLADVDGEQFTHYTEDNPKNWRSGFAVLTFHKGKLLPPETVEVIADGMVAFRGKAYDV